MPDVRILDPDTEAYHRVHLATAERAQQVARAEVQGVHDRINPQFQAAWAARGAVQVMANPLGVGLVSLRREAAYRWFTMLIQETESVVQRYLAKHTTDVWLIQSRREAACRLLHSPPRSGVESANERSIRNRLAASVAAWAKPGSTMLPSGGGKQMVTVSEQLIVDIHAVLELLGLCEVLHVERRRFLLGGILTIGAQPTPRTWLPKHVEDRLRLFTDSTARGSGPFVRLGLHVPHLELGRDPIPEDPELRLLPVAAGLPSDFSSKTEANASDVRLFGLVFYDAAVIARSLARFDRALRARWSLGAVEIVAALTATVAIFRDAIFDPEGSPAPRYTAETRAVFTVDEAYLERHLRDCLPHFAAALGTTLSDAEVASVVATWLSKFAVEPGAFLPVPPADGTRPRLTQFAPLLFRAGDKLLVDLYQVLLGLSSLLHEVDLEASDLVGKGTGFEDDVRHALLSAEIGLEVVPEMEREFRDQQRVVGEADVVVRLGDTAFLVECKSRRLRGVEGCVSYSHAMKRTRPFGQWARQVRRTAEYLSRHSKGSTYEVPSDIAWIVPVVCTASPESVWQDDPTLFLKRNEIPIVMSLGNLVAFIESRVWTDRQAVHQYRVGGDAPPSLPTGGDAAQYYAAALAASREERLADSIALYEQAVSARPAFSEAWANLGAMLARAGRSDQAMDACRRALELAPNDHVALTNLSRLYTGEGWFEQARALSERCVAVLTEQLGSEHPDVLEAQRLTAELEDIADDDPETR